MKEHYEQPQEFHFFASSVATWVTTSDTRTLPEVIELMESEGYPYSLFMVPLPWDADYEIRHYAPQVDGTLIVGTYTPKKSRSKKAANGR